MSKETSLYYSALKFHFFPRLLTLWDIKRVLENSSFTIDEVMEGSFQEFKFNKGLERFINSAILRFQPLYKYEGEKKVLEKGRMRNWLISTKNAITALIELEEKKQAKKLVIRLSNFISVLLTQYFSLRSIPEEFEEVFGEVTFKKECFKPIVSFLTNDTWNSLLRTLNFYDEFFLMLGASLHNINQLHDPLEEQEKRDSVTAIFRHEEEMESYLTKVLDNPPTFHTNKVLELATLMGVWQKRGNERRKQLFDDLSDRVKTSKTRDSFNHLLKDLFKGVSRVIEEDSHGFLNTFEEIGKRIAGELQKSIGITDKLAYKLPPTTLATLTSSATPNFNIFDELDPEEVPFLSEKTSKILANWSSSIRFLFFSLLGDYPSFAKNLKNIIRNPLASITFLTLLGPLFPYAIDNLMILDKRNVEKEAIATLIENFTTIFKKIVTLLKELKQKSSNSHFSRIIDFFATREVFWSQFRLFSEGVKEKIKKYSSGEELLNTISELQSLSDVSLASPIRQKRGIPEDIKDMYV